MNHFGQLSELDLTTTTLTPVQSRSGGGTGMVVLGDGRPGFGNDTYIADHNFTANQGTVFQRSATTDAFSTLSSGSPGRSVGDPWGLGFGSAPFGNDLYVMDFQGASTQPPLLYTVASDGTRSPFVEDATKWTNGNSPRYIEFTHGRAGFADALLVSDNATGEIWQVGSDRSLTVFLARGTLSSPSGLKFAPGAGGGGLFGSDLFVLDTGSGKLVTVTAGGAVSEFATELTLGLTGDLAFSADGNRLYIGSGDAIYEISMIPEPTSAAVFGALTLAAAATPRRRQ